MQVLRFCGLLKESEKVHRWAVELDPAMVTSVAHTRFAAGEYAGAVRESPEFGALMEEAGAEVHEARIRMRDFRAIFRIA